MRHRWAAVILGCVVTLGPQMLEAQTSASVPHGRWSRVRVAKWALLGAAVAFGGYALVSSRRADDAYGELTALCHTDAARCTLVDGRYMDATAERLYRTAVSSDRRAQIGIIGGQITVLGSASLFIYDLRNGRGPSDIPYPSAFAPAPRRSLVMGARIAF